MHILHGRFNLICLLMKMVVTYKLKAAAHTGLDIAPSERRHLTQLPGDLNGVVQKEAEAPLVTEACGTGHLSE